MIVGRRRRSSPRKISRAVVVVERITALNTPKVPLATIDRPANKPSRYKLNGPSSKRSPVPKNGIRIAKNIKGTSMSALLERVRIEIFPASAEKTTKARKITNTGQWVIGVDTTTSTKNNTVQIFTWEGSECTTECR